MAIERIDSTGTPLASPKKARGRKRKAAELVEAPAKAGPSKLYAIDLTKDDADDVPKTKATKKKTKAVQEPDGEKRLKKCVLTS